MSGMASIVPTAVDRPSCHHTSGAREERFQRTNPNGTEYTTAETAMQIHTANERSYSTGSPLAKSLLMASDAPSSSSPFAFA